jgi:glycosyltransferase involved in cell wall biosynthesis
MKNDIIKKGIHPSKITPVPMGIDLPYIKHSIIKPIADSRLKDKRVIVYLGTLDPPRNIDIMFKMVTIVKKVFPNILLILVGDTHDDHHRKWLQEKIVELGISNNIIWTGWLPQHNAWQYVRASEVGLSPIPRSFILDSSSPTKILEYIALGIPVVCNDNPDQEELIKTTDAGICVPYTPEFFSHAVIHLLLKYDRRTIKTFIRSQSNYISKNRNYVYISEELSNVYKRLIAN